jgi:hypothetical protein
MDRELSIFRKKLRKSLSRRANTSNVHIGSSQFLNAKDPCENSFI